MQLNKIIIISLLIIFFNNSIRANNPIEGGEKKTIISGSIKDASNGEQLLGATVLVKELKTGTATNMYGFYSLSLIPGKYTLVFSYIGYQSVEKIIELTKA